tara:strand:- start:106 stop:336 length:231 start_codon:yes stop_codon:yes gene_type:complete
MKKSEKELIEILLKNLINMHEKINIIVDNLGTELNEEQYQSQFYKEEDKLVDIDKDTYETMCEMMGTGKIPFMGIA